jgi:hypothetical protein
MRITVRELRHLIREGWFSSKQRPDPIAKLADLAGVDPIAVEKAMADYAADKGQDTWDWVLDDEGAIDQIVAAAKKISGNEKRRAWLEELASLFGVTVPDLERALSNFTNYKNEVSSAIASGATPKSFSYSDKGQDFRSAVHQLMSRHKRRQDEPQPTEHMTPSGSSDVAGALLHGMGPTGPFGN